MNSSVLIKVVTGLFNNVTTENEKIERNHEYKETDNVNFVHSPR